MFRMLMRVVAVVAAIGSLLAAQGGPVVLGQQEAMIYGPDPVQYGSFGTSVGVSGDTAVIGASAVPEGKTKGAYVFVRSGTDWVQQAKLTPSDPAAEPGFAGNVAISGERVVATAPMYSYQGHLEAGAAFVFVRSGTSWVEEAVLQPSDPVDGSRVGGSVAISGDTAIVGDVNEGGTGAAYVFRRVGSTWSQEAKLVASDGTPWDDFGQAVAISGGTAVVGARYATLAGGLTAGSAYVFVRNGTVWSEQARLSASDPAAVHLFGTSVSVSGDTAIVGAPGVELPVGVHAGAAYVFVRAGAAWAEEAKLMASDPVTFAGFGESVTIEDDLVVVGGPGPGGAGADGSGTAYVFAREGGTWSEELRLKAKNPQDGSHLGSALALAGDTVVAGVPSYDFPGTPPATWKYSVGVAYVFRLQECSGSVQALEVPRPGTPPNPLVLLPGRTSGPIVGSVWDPMIDPSVFIGFGQLLVITAAPANLPSPFGTILCDTSGGAFYFFTTFGQPFAVQIPIDCAAIGATFSAQALEWMPPGFPTPAIGLTNALDVTVGTY